MANVTKKTVLTTIDGTPKKRVFLSIISDYDLKTGVCELIDNALDVWRTTGAEANLEISVVLDVDRQFIRVKDNAGGVGENDAELLIAPGASRNDGGQALIGVFGVGGKRAGIALGELVEIRTRQGNGKSLAIDLNNEWIESPDWDLDIYEIPDIDPGTTIVDITKVRQGFGDEDVAAIEAHLGATYAWFIERGCAIQLNGCSVSPTTFDVWAYPPDFPPRQAKFKVEPVQGRFLDVTLSGGLIHDRDPEQDNYGVYFYCNHRLIVKELRVRDVGYFVSAEAGVPHPDASLCRVIVEFYGSAELMPWNSSKSAVNYGHPAFAQIRTRVIDFTSYYSGLSRRRKYHWPDAVFAHDVGDMEEVEAATALSPRKKVLPKLPRSRNPTHIEVLRERNKERLAEQPWILGLVEAMGFVDLLGRQKYETRNRAALIHLDSNFEIALKEYIVHRRDLFPQREYPDTRLVHLFRERTTVINEIQTHAGFPPALIDKVNHYYNLRNVLVHQRASVLITDAEVEDYRKTVEHVLTELFGVDFPP